MKAWKIHCQAMKMFEKLSPGYIYALVLSNVFSGISPYFNIYLSAEIINRLSKGEGRHIFALVLVTIVGNFIIAVANIFLGRWFQHKNELYMEEEKRYLVEKIQLMDYCDIENPKVQQLRRNIIEAARMDARGTGAFADGLCTFTRSITSIIVAAFFFFEMMHVFLKSGFGKEGFFWILILIFLVGINVIVTFWYQKTEGILAQDNAVMLADENRIDEALDCYNKGKDVRLYRQDRFIMPIKKKYLIDIHFDVFSRFFKKVFKYETAPVITRYATEIFTYLFVCIYALKGVFEVGSIIKYIGFMKNMIDSIMNFFQCIGTLRFNTPFLEQYMQFYYYPSKMHDGTLALDRIAGTKYEIEFCDVSFSYPESNTYALRHISFKLKEGERIAVVGVNGSGKSTLVKLLCRLYDPTEGEIRLNGINIKNYKYDEYIQLFSAVFQDFKLFSFSLFDNIALSNERDKERAKQCLKLAGFEERLERLPEGLETSLYKDFDINGIEISGGEAQKIAIARALYQDTPFILLDEPTAALDPVSEYELYLNFDKISSGKTAVYISHRLSSCRFCDCIFVLDRGELVQTGNHKALIEDTYGIYKKLWNAQAQYYTE